MQYAIKDSKYVMFGIFSFVDYSHIVNTHLIARLNRHFRDFSHDKGQEAHNMLIKTEVMFQINSIKAVQEFARVNLLHYRFGFDVGVLYMRPLLTILKQYEPKAVKLLEIRED